MLIITERVNTTEPTIEGKIIPCIIVTHSYSDFIVVLISVSIVVLMIVTILIHIIIAVWCYRIRRKTGKKSILYEIKINTPIVASAPSQAPIPQYENVEVNTIYNTSNDLKVETCAAYGITPQRQHLRNTEFN